MALITSAATGNFNATGTWTGGVVPGAGDEARVANGHVVTITANATCTLLSNNGTGYFVLNSGVTLTANVTNATGSTQNNPCVRFTSASPASATIVGNLTATGGASNAHAVLNSSTGTLNITGNVTGGSIQTSNGVLNLTTGTVNITGNCTGGTYGNCYAVNNASGQIVVTGNVTGGSATGGIGFPHGICTDTTGTVTVTGIVTGGSIAGANGVTNNAAGNITVVGEVIATNGANGINSTNTSSVVRASGSMTYSANGTLPIMANRFFLNATPSLARTRYALNGSSTYFDMSGADVAAAGGVSTSDVRSGVTYAGLTGTCAVPATGSVALGVPVDNTTGTALLTGASVASAVWGAAAKTITGGTVDTLTNAPTVPSASAIASQVRTELSTELARVDQAISSRLASASYTAPSAVPTAAQNATAVWGAATKEITGGTVTTLTNAPSVPSAASIRAEIDSNSTQLAAIKSKTNNLPASPAATGDIPLANITAIKAKTDLLNTDRLAQVSTVSTTGAQLAAALS